MSLGEKRKMLARCVHRPHGSTKAVDVKSVYCRSLTDEKMTVGMIMGAVCLKDLSETKVGR